MSVTKKIIKIISVGFIIIFAVIGLASVGAFLAIKFGWTNTRGIVDSQDRFLTAAVALPSWTVTPEWQTLAKAATADAPAINKAAAAAGIPARLIVAQLVVEQLRLYNTDREVYKQIFEPLQILGVQSQFSWGVMGIKQETAIAVEQHLVDPASPWYLGTSSAHLLDFQTADQDSERFQRLTDDHDHYYSYLYTALFLKQIETQWKNAGFDISARPEILSTLYNIGFAHSKPSGTPNSGGAEIIINNSTSNTTYSFGDLAAQFYYSDALISEFPR